MTALQVLKELKKEKWPELKTGDYNLPLIIAAMHRFAELRQCNVSGSLPPDKVDLLLKMQIEECRVYIDRRARDYGQSSYQMNEWFGEIKPVDWRQ